MRIWCRPPWATAPAYSARSRWHSSCSRPEGRSAGRGTVGRDDWPRGLPGAGHAADDESPGEDADQCHRQWVLSGLLRDLPSRCDCLVGRNLLGLPEQLVGLRLGVVQLLARVRLRLVDLALGLGLDVGLFGQRFDRVAHLLPGGVDLLADLFGLSRRAHRFRPSANCVLATSTSALTL